MDTAGVSYCHATITYYKKWRDAEPHHARPSGERSEDYHMRYFSLLYHIQQESDMYN
jgi:hypothetical protein